MILNVPIIDQESSFHVDMEPVMQRWESSNACHYQFCHAIRDSTSRVSRLQDPASANMLLNVIEVALQPCSLPG